MKLRVMTFNIQHGRNHNLPGDVIDLPLMAENVKKFSPSIVGFNEVRCGINSVDDAGFPDEPAFFASALKGEAYFGKAISVRENCLYGNCLFTKLPLLHAETVLIPNPDDAFRHETRCVIKSLIDVGGKPVTVLTSHFGLTHEEQVNCVDTVLSLAEGCNTPVIFMGDLNMTDDDPLIQRLSSAFTDVAAALNNTELTFPSDSPKIRIDYIFVKDIKPVGIFANKVIASDHYGIVADLDII